MKKSPAWQSIVAFLASLPWCCILPASLSMLSLSGAVVARFFLAKFIWIFLPVSIILIVRAFWLLYVKHQGASWTHWVTWAAALAIVILWSSRL